MALNYQIFRRQNRFCAFSLEKSQTAPEGRDCIGYGVSTKKYPLYMSTGAAINTLTLAERWKLILSFACILNGGPHLMFNHGHTCVILYQPEMVCGIAVEF